MKNTLITLSSILGFVAPASAQIYTGGQLNDLYHLRDRVNSPPAENAPIALTRFTTFNAGVLTKAAFADFEDVSFTQTGNFYDGVLLPGLVVSGDGVLRKAGGHIGGTSLDLDFTGRATDVGYTGNSGLADTFQSHTVTFASPVANLWVQMSYLNKDVSFDKDVTFVSDIHRGTARVDEVFNADGTTFEAASNFFNPDPFISGGIYDEVTPPGAIVVRFDEPVTSFTYTRRADDMIAMSMVVMPQVESVPEPSSAALLGLGALGLLVRRKR